MRVLALRLPAEVAEQARERVYARAKRKKQVVRPETLLLAGWVLLLSTWNARDFAAEELFWLYRSRWQIELLIKQLKQFLLLVRLRSSHPETVRTTVLAALVAWALQEEEGQALLRTLAVLPAQGQESLVQAYLPLLEQWQAGESGEEATDEPRRLAVGCQLPQSLACGGLGPVERCTGAVLFATFETLSLPEPSPTRAPTALVPGLGPTALPGNICLGGLPLIGCLSSRLWAPAPCIPTFLPFI